MKIRHLYRIRQRIKKFWRRYFPVPEVRKPEVKIVSPPLPAPPPVPVVPVSVPTPARLNRRFNRYIKRCLVTQKFMFTREQVEWKRKELLKKKSEAYLRIYLCQFCGFYHLTHKKTYNG